MYTRWRWLLAQSIYHRYEYSIKYSCHGTAPMPPHATPVWWPAVPLEGVCSRVNNVLYIKAMPARHTSSPRTHTYCMCIYIWGVSYRIVSYHIISYSIILRNLWDLSLPNLLSLPRDAPKYVEYCRKIKQKNMVFFWFCSMYLHTKYKKSILLPLKEEKKKREQKKNRER